MNVSVFLLTGRLGEGVSLGRKENLRLDYQDHSPMNKPISRREKNSYKYHSPTPPRRSSGQRERKERASETRTRINLLMS
jgi:hypothetical protein